MFWLDACIYKVFKWFRAIFELVQFQMVIGLTAVIHRFD
jgi:hypothetical protein